MYELPTMVNQNLLRTMSGRSSESSHATLGGSRIGESPGGHQAEAEAVRRPSEQQRVSTAGDWKMYGASRPVSGPIAGGSYICERPGCGGKSPRVSSFCTACGEAKPFVDGFVRSSTGWTSQSEIQCSAVLEFAGKVDPILALNSCFDGWRWWAANQNHSAIAAVARDRKSIFVVTSGDWTAERGAAEDPRDRARGVAYDWPLEHTIEGERASLMEPFIIDNVLVLTSGGSVFGVDVFADRGKPVCVATLEPGWRFRGGLHPIRREDTDVGEVQLAGLAVNETTGETGVAIVNPAKSTTTHRVLLRRDQAWPSRIGWRSADSQLRPATRIITVDEHLLIVNGGPLRRLVLRQDSTLTAAETLEKKPVVHHKTSAFCDRSLSGDVKLICRGSSDDGEIITQIVSYSKGSPPMAWDVNEMSGLKNIRLAGALLWGIDHNSFACFESSGSRHHEETKEISLTITIADLCVLGDPATRKTFPLAVTFQDYGWDAVALIDREIKAARISDLGDPYGSVCAAFGPIPLGDVALVGFFDAKTQMITVKRLGSSV